MQALAPPDVDTDYNDLLNRAVALHYADMKAAVRRRGHSTAFAAEVVHDLYLKLASRPEALHGKRSLGAFLCRAATNLAIDRLRRTRFEEQLFARLDDDTFEIPAETAAPDHRLDVQARIAVLRQAIAELPPRRRAVFILHRLHHMSPEEIARRLKISRNMVNRHLLRALTHCLDRLFETE